MQSFWFGNISEGRCTPFTGDAATSARRVREIRTSMDVFIPPDWQQAVACGVCHDRAEYLFLLQKVCIAGSEQAVREQYAAKDVELLQMVRTLDEMDTIINVLSERVADWYQIRHPSFSLKYRRTPAHMLVKSIGEQNRERGGALGKVATEITSLVDTRTSLARVVSARACEVMPNTSALIGGLVAARLHSHAGGLKELSIRTHAPSPKHGIIFQHRRVHNASRDVRGKVARVLAGKLAIAARLDFYRGCAVPAFLEDAQARIDRAGTAPGEGQP